jgi:acyl-CoA reductase-like NAD-dependent aldehyde dehydrogenase/nicotinamidase-related amidase
MKPALLLVDLQADFLATAGLQPEAEILIEQAAKLLSDCRQRGIPIIHVWTTVHRDNDRRLPHWKKSDRWLCVAGTSGHEPPQSLRPLSGETIIHKTGFNSFASGELENALRKLNCDVVIIAGLHLHACVRTAAVETLERGLQVFIAENAVASNDPIHAASTRRWLSERCVSFESTGGILARLDDGARTALSASSSTESQEVGDKAVRAPLIHRSPRRTDEVLFEVEPASPDRIQSATEATQSAWTNWRRTSFFSRQQPLENFAMRLESAAPDLARQMVLEIGKPISHGLEEVCRAAANVRDVIRRATTFGVPPSGGMVQEPPKGGTPNQAAGIVRHQPLGVVALISPWNNPVAIPVGKIAPALIYGNCIVWKPAPAATRIAENILQLLFTSGIPAAAVRLVTGDHTTAQQLAANENINAVTITGSLLAGHAMQEICARRIIPLQAELSGNNAAIVWDDTDLKHAAAQIAWGAFGFAGQRCTANRRVIVSAARFEDFLHELKSAAEKMVWGDPLESTTEIGPVINVAKRDEIAVAVARAEVNGSAHKITRLHENLVGQDWVKAGAYAQPVIVCCDQANHSLVQEETMGPLLVVQRAENFEHALALCNGVRHGLAAALFSESRELQKKFLEEARAGILKFNTSTAGVDVSLPFGGWKASGIGPPEHGDGDALFYTQMQAVYGGRFETGLGRS